MVHDHQIQEDGSFEIIFDLVGYQPEPDSPMYLATFTTPDSGSLSIRCSFMVVVTSYSSQCKMPIKSFFETFLPSPNISDWKNKADLEHAAGERSDAWRARF